MRSSPPKSTSRLIEDPADKSVPSHHQLVCTHLLDGIYQGFVNSSYARDGFGIIQTENFDTYIGFFKFNKIHGTGLIIYRDGAMIYGTFKNGVISGLSLTDSRSHLHIGTFSQQGMKGIGFEYISDKKLWKMNRYHKGVSIEVLNEEQMEDEHDIPDMMNLEPAVLRHYINYRMKKMFKIEDHPAEDILKMTLEDINLFYLHDFGDKSYFGAIVDGKYEGLGVFYDNPQKSVVEAGYYREGALDGYGIKFDRINQKLEEGKYRNGVREGLFSCQSGKKTQFLVYNSLNGTFEERKSAKMGQIKKERRIYNYQKKDFMSSSHSINFYQIKGIFESGVQKAERLQQQADQAKIQANRVKSKSPYTVKHRHKPSQTFSNQSVALSEKPSVQIMKQKLIYFQSKRRSTSKNNKKQNQLSSKFLQPEEQTFQEKGMITEDDRQIAAEESPIWSEPNLSAIKGSYDFEKQQNNS